MLHHHGPQVAQVRLAATRLPVEPRSWSVVLALAEGHHGAVWVGTTGGLARFADGRFTADPTRHGLLDEQVRSLSVDPEHAIWIATARGISRFADGRFTHYRARDHFGESRATLVSHDREGTLWVGTDGGGLYRFQGGRSPSTRRATGCREMRCCPSTERGRP